MLILNFFLKKRKKITPYHTLGITKWDIRRLQSHAPRARQTVVSMSTYLLNVFSYSLICRRENSWNSEKTLTWIFLNWGITGFPSIRSSLICCLRLRMLLSSESAGILARFSLSDQTHEKLKVYQNPKYLCLFGVYKKDAKDFKNFFYSS